MSLHLRLFLAGLVCASAYSMFLLIRWMFGL